MKSIDFGNTVKGFSVETEITYTRNSGKVVTVTNFKQGFIDDTIGLGAVIDLPFKKGMRNFDIGGGQWDEVSKFIKKVYGAINLVYDPYGRTSEHNAKILAEVRKNPVDSVTSNSVLNVIIEENERINHLILAYDSLKTGGCAFFKIWRGDGSGTPGPGKYNPIVMQLNLEAQYFLPEIKAIFGKKVILLRDDIGNSIIAYKK